MVLTVLLIIIYLAFISLGLPDSLLGSAWPSMYPIMGVPISYAGFVSMIIAGGTIVSSLLSDKMIKKYGSGLVTTISVSMTALALLGFSLSNEFYQLILYAIPLGLGAGSVDTALNNFVAINYKAKHMNWLHSFWGVGAMTGPIIMGYYLERGFIFQIGYRTVAIIQFSLVLLLIISLPLWKMVKSVEKKDHKKQKNQIVNIRKLLHLKGAKQALIAFFCYCSIEATMGLWGSSFVVMNHGISSEEAAKWTTLFFLGITIGRFLSGFVTLKFNNRQMVHFGIVLISIGIIMMIIPITQFFMLISFIMIGLGCAPIFPSLLHQTPDNFGIKYSQSLMGVQMASAYVGTTFVPPIFGLLASLLGYRIMPFFIGIILLLMIIMVTTLNKRVDNINLV